MRRLPWHFPFALALLLATTSPALAVPHIRTTKSEILSLDPLRVRTTFEVTLVSPGPGDYDYVGIWATTAVTNPPTYLYECAAPASWYCTLSATGNGTGVWFAINGIGGSWAVTNTFSIVSDRVAPCMNFLFDNPILAKTPSPHVNDNYYVYGCLDVDAPTPARAATWGSLKVHYR